LGRKNRTSKKTLSLAGKVLNQKKYQNSRRTNSEASMAASILSTNKKKKR